jgi:Tol biopolymer transport system component/tRNA A-37 threonylcarbamoyl transferase component Bud32
LLTSGTRLGPYEIQALVGAGGMGDVYRARDTRLDRTVAIKVLKESLAADPEFRARFEREARAISQLSHPNICTLHDVGEAGAVNFLVMEYVEGETLAARLAREEIPLDHAMTYGIQIAEALERAHRQGIVHGDLKPGNVMLTKTGVKLLDFGLVRQIPAASPEASDSLTRAVHVGAQPVFGTLAYLAPEQLEEKRPDARTDIFAFGALFYEVVTGQRAFRGDSHAAVVASIMRSHPAPMAAARPVPPALDRVVATCLAKDPDERWQSAGDLARELKWIASGGAVASASYAAHRGGMSNRIWIAAAALLALSTLALAALTLGRRPPETAVYRTSVLLPEGLLFPGAGQLGGLGRFGLSPDGRRIAFVAADPEGNVRLWLRPLDSLIATVVPGTDGAGSPFWSADSRLVAFVAQGQLKTINPADGMPTTLAASINATGSWNAANQILFSPTPASPLHVIPAGGGTARPVTTLDSGAGDVLHRNPFFLPDGRHFIYVAVSARSGETTAARASYVASLDSPAETRLLVEGGSTLAYSQGHLVFLRDNRLVAQPFDVERLELTGEPRPITEQVELAGPSSTAFSVAESGLLAYQPASGPVSQLVWFDRSGQRQGTLGEPADYGDVTLSPDGRRAAVSVGDYAVNTRDIWVFDISRGVRTRVTFDPADDVTPVWSADGTQLMFASNRAGHFDIYRKNVAGVGKEELVFQDDSEKYPTGWSRDGSSVVFWTFGPEGAQVRLLTLQGDRSSTVYIGSPTNPARLSHDGRWAAYYSNESGRSEVYVVPFPRPSEKWQLSNAGGSLPQWTGDGREVVYLGRDNRLMAVPLEERGSRLDVGVPRPLFDTRPVGPRSFFDVAPDGQRFLINTRRSDSLSSSITLLQNWPRLIVP